MGGMSNRSDAVDTFLAQHEHPLRPQVERLRLAILDSDDSITEHIKWNAPSFCVDGVDRVTFNLRPTDRIQLVLHRGAKKRDDSAQFSFADESGLVEWITPDRGTITIAATALTPELEARVLAVVGAWMRAG